MNVASELEALAEAEELARTGAAEKRSKGKVAGGKVEHTCYVIYDPDVGHEVVDEIVTRLETLYPSLQGRIFVEPPRTRRYRASLLAADSSVESLFRVYDGNQDGVMEASEWRELGVKLGTWVGMSPIAAVTPAHTVLEHMYEGGETEIREEVFEKKFFRIENNIGIQRKDIGLFIDSELSHISPPVRSQVDLVVLVVTGPGSFTHPTCTDDLDFFQNRSKMDERAGQGRLA